MVWGKVPTVLHRGRKGNVFSLSTRFCYQEGKGTAAEKELKLGSECAASPCEEPVLVPAAVSHLLPEAVRQVVSTWQLQHAESPTASIQLAWRKDHTSDRKPKRGR